MAAFRISILFQYLILFQGLENRFNNSILFQYSILRGNPVVNANQTATTRYTLIKTKPTPSAMTKCTPCPSVCVSTNSWNASIFSPCMMSPLPSAPCKPVEQRREMMKMRNNRGINNRFTQTSCYDRILFQTVEQTKNGTRSCFEIALPPSLTCVGCTYPA